LRAKVANDSDTLVEASQRLGHADTAILGPGGAKAIIVENLILLLAKYESGLKPVAIAA